MKGTNKLELSNDDVLQAMQDWTDKHLVDKPVVASLEMKRGEYGGTQTVLTLNPRPEPVCDPVDPTARDRVR